MKLNLNSFILILPVGLSWLTVNPNPQLVLVSFLVMAGAEALRQYFSATFMRAAVTPRQLFFFGIMYKDSESFLLNKKSPAMFTGMSKSRKVLLLIAVYVLTLSLKFSSAFEDLNFLYSAFFSLVITLWVYCGTYRQLSWVLLLQLTGTSVAFASDDGANGFAYFVWLVLSLWVQLHAFTWHLTEESRSGSDEKSILSSSSMALKSASAALILIICFRTADVLVPEYGEVKASHAPAPENEEPGATAAGPIKKKELRVPKKFVSNLAKYKLQAGAIDFSKMNVKDIKIPSGSPGGLFKFPNFKLNFGEHGKDLEDIKNNLAGDKPVRSEDLDKLSEIARKIKLPPTSGGSSEMENKEGVNDNTSSADHTDQIIEDRIQKLKGQVKEGQQTDDDAAAYARSRKQLADDIDKMMQQDQKNTLAKEELSLQKFFDRLLVFLKRFSFLIALCLLAAWWLRKRVAVKNEETAEGKDFTLPKEVRVQLKHLYKLLLKGGFTPKDEVIKSYHLVDLAFREIDFARKEDLPPVVFLERLQGAMPGISKSAQVPTELFCRVFYGDKTPADKEISELRLNMRDLMKKLRVI